ncbi:Peptidase propeptide and YPEB domain-containing protein [Methylobacterium sp. 174MFSha1.1]|uniref:PepSY domain-containing protein n=1 Tax=Methylobacterium sp. 174MFSha1.1 TaxID=1502749 RepID=UPI0008ED9E44|nr:PepSY domain-containing protein [Methylobacterium sp. 174MFSha1.1]SFU78460.1 Peptidase propeptide and YPEB domain-containing protein [Methylobacterium sp. 174MFSha1.1]
MLTRFLATAGALALTTGLALAQTTAPTAPTAPGTAPVTTAPATTAPAATGDVKDMKEWQAAKLAKVSLADAIATAEKKDGNGRAIDADFEKADSKNPTHWSIKVVYPDGKLVEHGINADTGELYKSENQPIERYFTRLKVADFNNAKVSLKDALAIAEKQAGGGKAYEAEVEREGSAVAYEIKVALADNEKEVKVGPDGQIMKD